MLKRTPIKRKTCKCGCGKLPTISCNGFNYSCLSDEEKRAKGTIAKLNRRKSNNRKAQGRKLLAAQRELNGDSELDLWFAMRMNILYPVCANCGAVRELLKDDERFKKQWKSCQAHLLPKRHFKSIMTHPLNGMVLGTGYSGMCNCHDFYDSAWSNAETMDIWPEVVRRFKILYPLIPQSEHRFIPQQLLNYIQ